MALETKMVNSFDPTNLYWDKGSGADMDGAFWRVNPPSGYYTVGDYCQGNYSSPAGNVVVVTGSDDDELAPPVDYALVWNDKDSGADEDGSIWIPMAPDGYVALGGVAQRGYDKPDRPDIRCVRADLVERASFGSLIWDDKGSGADDDVSIYAIESPGGTIPGTFHPQPNYNPGEGDVFVIPSS
ncbi:MAG: Vps62-related protein [Acidobacteriota bacterium]